MPTVEKTHGSRVYIRPLEQRFEIGDQADVDEEMAAYLCEERGDFERVDALQEGDEWAGDSPPWEEPDGDTNDEPKVDADDVVDTLEEAEKPRPEDAIEMGLCPWCSEYEGENVGMHASRSHPDEWDEYNEED
ncbi:hypothetical protein [Natrinema halophilum]|uniref:Uncharacterized protein n=1 Tax=Natrinema halophilum TaxID=1699371 RepID=A0A7D5KHV2_9EURY|nr:hypothetical protein [Natrinema halophilum]QLG47899.1 hypothetical protein HYG82_03080 [Natrinema halophilum]